MEVESPRRLWALVNHLPPESALAHALRREAEKPKVMSIQDFAKSYRQMRKEETHG